MADPPTPLSLPSSLSYPIIVTRILIQPGTVVKRGTRLLEYAFTSDSSKKALARLARGEIKELEDGVREGDMVGTWESEIEGEVSRWSSWMKSGETLDRKAAGKEVIYIQQPCTHPVQLHGMCGVCGADLTTDDYLTAPTEDIQAGPSRHGGHEMSHDALGVTVSTNEAKRLESQTKDTLLSSKKLTLIVDLDQTIIHTTVDPTVGEWMAEIEDDEEEEGSFSPPKEDTSQNELSQDQTDSGEMKSTTPPHSPKRKVERDKNPNAEALQDVARFQLADDLPPGYVPPKKGQGRGNPAHDRWYYTKPRPGLPKFLEEMDQKYEMHVYTMGTRSYADAICNVIDPEGKYFGGRILSRDESGSFSSKNLRRLFPTDQSMVVVIDDRADVWGDIPNLVKVVPYDFFLGIGDINSSFLPPTPTTPKSNPLPSSPETSSVDSPSPATPHEVETEEGLIAQAKLLDELSEKRPLAKLQEKMEKEEAAKEEVQIAVNGEVGESKPSGGIVAEELRSQDETTTTRSDVQNEKERSTTPPLSPPRLRKPLLNPYDFELDRIADILTNIHQEFYSAYNSRSKISTSDNWPMGCDVELIIPELKSQVLAGCRIVFSGVIPRLQAPETSEVFQQAETYGATPTTRVSANTTHCVIATLGTEKMYEAKRLGAKVVWLEWFTQSIALWRRLEESDFEVHWKGAPPPGVPSSGTATPNLLDIPELANPIVEDGDDGNGGGKEGKVTENGQPEDSEGDVDDVELQGKGWDDDVQAELDAFLDGSSEFGDTDMDAESLASAPATPIGSVPGTPRKRVRYADEESLPLESFKDPLPPDGSESPPKKRPRPLLLEAPREGDVPSQNKFQWKGKMKERHPDDDYNDNVGGLVTLVGDAEEGHSRQDEEEDHASVAGVSEADSEDDLFAQMLKDSLGDDDDDDQPGEEEDEDGEGS